MPEVAGVARVKAVNTEARGGSVMAGHARLRKYQIKFRADYWLARVPYGSWKRFDTWAQAGEWLAVRHVERVAKEAEFERKRERDSHAHA